MKDVVEDKKIVDKKVLRCYYNICKYYNQNIKLIEIFLNR